MSPRPPAVSISLEGGMICSGIGSALPESKPLRIVKVYDDLVSEVGGVS
jgi:hypothetical protein